MVMDNREYFILFISKLYDRGIETITKKEIVEFSENSKIPIPQWFINDSNNRKSRGVYFTGKFIDEVKRKEDIKEYQVDISDDEKVEVEKVEVDSSEASLKIRTVEQFDESSLIPDKHPCYVPFGVYSKVFKIINSSKFFPTFISGHSGNGKTLSVEQACAVLNRPFILVSMTPDTDESDLLGNYVLIDGEMVWRDGPVTTAARLGATLCIDEVDYGSKNLSTLQSILEGKRFFLKKKGELVVPQKGFNIFATANTKGKGSDDGRYMYTNILNESFLDRFKANLEQKWPTPTIEKRILDKELEKNNCINEGFSDKLVQWANSIRKLFDEGGVDEVISPRKLVHIIEAFSIFKKKNLAIELCLTRFDDEIKETFLDFYNKIDVGIEKEFENN